MGTARKIGRLLVDLVRSPRRTLKAMPGLMESARMRLVQDSTFRRKTDLAMASHCPSDALDRVRQLWNPQSVLDIGCGSGKVLDYFFEHGLHDLVGLEGSAVAIEVANHPELIRQVDLAKPVDLSRKFDMVYTVEVAEHIKPSAAETFVDTCARHSDRIFFTAAHPGQGGLGHLNEQPLEYWIQKFVARGFVLDETATTELRARMDDMPENLVVFRRN